METRMLPADQWKFLLKTFLKSTVADLDLQVELSNKEIIIQTTNRTHLERLQKVLSSPEMAQVSLQYTLTKTGEKVSAIPAPKQEVIYPKPISVVPKSGQKIFKKIFGKKILDRVGRTRWSDELTSEDSRVLYCIVAEDLADLTASQIKTYRKCLTTATFAELRDAFAEDEKEYKPLAIKSSAAESKILAAHIDKILYSKPNKNKENVLYFDYGLLASCITTPTLTITEEKANDETLVNYQMKINKNHLINFLSTIFEEGFVLNINGERGHPICFNMQRTVPRANVIMLVLDCSGSMSTSFKGYIAKIKAFVEHASQDPNYSDAEILIKDFGTTDRPTKYFKLSELPKINEFLNTLTAGGTTALYETFAKALAEVRPMLIDKNVIVIPFTDGKNEHYNFPDYGLDGLNIEIAKIKEQTNPIKIYAIGYGDEYDAVQMQKLADMAEGIHIKLNKIEDFSAIHDHVKEMSKARVIVRFLQEIHEQSNAFNVVTYEDELGVATSSLQVPGNFSVGGTQYRAEQGGLQLLPAQAVRPQEGIELANLKAPGDNGVFPTHKRRGSAPTTITLPAVERNPTLSFNA